MIDRDRAFHRLMTPRARKRPKTVTLGKRSPRTISIPALPLSGDASAERKSVIHVSGGFCWGKVNGQWLYKTRQIVTGRNKHPARWMLWHPNRRPRIPSALRSAKLLRWRIR
jgi:hypothetical protein